MKRLIEEILIGETQLELWVEYGRYDDVGVTISEAKIAGLKDCDILAKLSATELIELENQVAKKTEALDIEDKESNIVEFLLEQREHCFDN